MNENKLSPIDYYLQNDASFNELFPPFIQLLAKRHWTPLRVVKHAVAFLNTGYNCKILDIGSGVGKFCLAGAAYAPNVHFFGVEQRSFLLDYALAAKKKLRLKNVTFMEANFTQIDLRQYHHFYFFNSFYENLDDSDRIDEQISHSYSLYDYYVRYLHNSLRTMPAGTKIVSYHTLWDEIPREYRLVDTLENGALNFWVKR